ncbi:MAG: T9SS type A sorting domain-containing protein [Bacteroidetes bacterium]|nr:T9SS type A sorting domain-containing protein [Bacteroidota bacterium]
MISQIPEAEWVYILDGFQDADITDLVVDNEGSTYVSANYSGRLEIKDLKLQLPPAPHVHGLLLKLDKHGKAVWALAMQSAFDNRINDISLAPNGDILITGFADGVVTINGIKNKINFGRDKNRDEYHRPVYVYGARFTSKGELLWATPFHTPWGEGLSITSNSNNETRIDLYHKNWLKYEDEIIDTVSRDKRYEEKELVLILNEKGEFIRKDIFSDRFGSSYIPRIQIITDKQNNYYRYGNFVKCVRLTETDSLVNDSYMDGLDSYIAKYSPDGKLLWSFKAGGQNAQQITEIKIDDYGNIFACGSYSFECVLGDGINIIQQSKFEYKSGNSFFFFGLSPDGDLNFARYEEQGDYGTTFTAQSLCFDNDGNCLIVGAFNDTVNVDGYQLNTSLRESQYFISLWQNDKIKGISTQDVHTNYFIVPRKIDSGGGQFASCGLYHGHESYVNIKGKKIKLTLDDYGRSSFILGGKLLPPHKKDTIPLLASRKIFNLNQLKPLLACVSETSNQEADVWYPAATSVENSDSSRGRSQINPCGLQVGGKEALLYPNPTRSLSKLKLTGMKDGTTGISVFSASGQLLFSQQIIVPEDTFEINLDLGSAAAGIYFVRIVHGGFEKALRLVKVD